jgi:hypothetical protein
MAPALHRRTGSLSVFLHKGSTLSTHPKLQLYLQLQLPPSPTLSNSHLKLPLLRLACLNLDLSSLRLHR